MSDELERDDIQEQENVNLAGGEDELDSVIEASDETGDDNATPSDDEQQTLRESENDTDAEPEDRMPDDNADDQTDDDDDDEPVQKRITDLRKGYQGEHEKRLEITRKYMQTLEEKLDGFEELTSEEARELREEDPDAYLEYLEELDEKRSIIAEKQKLEQEEATQQLTAQYERAQSVVVEFAKELGVVSDNMDSKTFNETLAGFMEDETLVKASKLLNKYGMKPDPRTGVYSVDQLRLVYNDVTKDAELTKAKSQGYGAAVDNINKAKNGKSKLAAAPPSGPKYTPKKKAYSQAEVLSMGEDEADALLAEDAEE